MTDTANDAHAAIGAYLDRHDLKYQPLDAGFVVGFRDAENDTVALSVLLAAPTTGGITLEAAAPRELDQDRWVAALWTLNEWNATVRGPKAVLVRNTDGADDEATTARIVLYDWMQYRADVPDDVVDAFLDNGLSGACVFFGVASEGAAPVR